MSPVLHLACQAGGANRSSAPRQLRHCNLQRAKAKKLESYTFVVLTGNKSKQANHSWIYHERSNVFCKRNISGTSDRPRLPNNDELAVWRQKHRNIINLSQTGKLPSGKCAHN